MSEYLLDSNAFITAHRNFYAHDIVPSFWEWLSEDASDEIFIIDKVNHELQKDDDFLSRWVKSFLSRNPENLIETSSNQAIIFSYSKVIHHITSCGYYKPGGYSQWFDADQADPFLIATAMVNDLVIVTLERRHHDLNTMFPTKQEPKIPDVADALGVTCIDLYDFMRRLGCKI